MSEILTSRAFRTLLESPCPTKEFGSRIVGEDRKIYNKGDVTTLVNRLRRLDLIRVFDGKYFITDAGRAMADPSRQVRGNTVSRMGGDYTCPELGRTCHRVGAYDFLEIPSVFGSERRPYKFRSGV